MNNLPPFDTFLDTTVKEHKTYSRLQEVLDKREELMMEPCIIFISAEEYHEVNYPRLKAEACNGEISSFAKQTRDFTLL